MCVYIKPYSRCYELTDVAFGRLFPAEVPNAITKSSLPQAKTDLVNHFEVVPETLVFLPLISWI
jgi:hypothetical protein